MSDELETVTEPTEEVAAEIEAPQGETVDTSDFGLEEWKAHTRKHEKRAKENFEAAQLWKKYKAENPNAKETVEAAEKWREYEAAQKPAQERMAEELAATKAEAESARVALLRYEVAAEMNIPSEAIRLLTGSSREELEEAADALVALMATQSKPRTPVPDESQGRPTVVKLGQLTKEDLANMTPGEINEARRQGRLDEALGK